MIVSFAWTTPALLAGEKNVTRREWQEKYARMFHAGDLVQAWDKQPRFKGARRVGTIRLTADPYVERLCDIPDADWHGEGFEYLQAIPDLRVHGQRPRDLWEWWRDPSNTDTVYVVRFELVEVLG